MKKKKAFTLIELLAVIVLIVIIGLIFVPDVLKIINKSGTDTYFVKEKLISRAGEDYTALNKVELPSVVGEEELIDIQTLITSNLMTPVYDLAKRDEACLGYLVIQKNATAGHEYKACLFCENYQTQDSDCHVERLETIGAGSPILLMYGNSPYYVELGDIYDDPGCAAYDTDNTNITSNIVTTGLPVSTSNVGISTVTYNVQNSKGIPATPVSRQVVVRDTTDPEVVFGTNGDSTPAKTHSSTVTVTDLGGLAQLKYLWSSSTATPDNASFVNTFTSGQTVSSPSSLNDTAYLWIYAVDNNGNDIKVKTNAFVFDNLKPVVATATITSNNSISNKKAKNGNALTLNVTFNESISNTPTITIGGRNATVSGSGTSRTATYTIPAGESALADGNLSISISDYQDDSSNVGDTVTTTTSGGYVYYDGTAPVCTVAGGNTSWTAGSRVITGTCSDSGSGCTGNLTYTFSTDTNTTTAGPGSGGGTGTISDNVGNTATCAANQTVKIDKTPPTCASSGGSASWQSIGRNITLTGTCSDSGSGCTGNASATFSTDINTTTASPGTVFDSVGNSVACPANQTVRIDHSSPSCASSGGNDSWHGIGSNVTITGTCSDLVSGCSGNASATYSTDTATTTASPGTVYDVAGNPAACAANQHVYVDHTPPSAPSVNLNGYASDTWTRGNVTSTLSSSDNLSGVAYYQYSHDNASWGSWPANPWTINWDGQWAFYTRAVDNAGNASGSASPYIIRRDTVAPSITINGSNPASVTIGSGYSDAGASAYDAIFGATGVSASGSVDTGHTGTYYITYSSSDSLGNNSTATRTVNVTGSAFTSTYTCSVSGYKSDGLGWTIDTSTVIQGTYGTHHNYYGIMYFGASTFNTIRSNAVNYDITKVEVQMHSHYTSAHTVRLFVGKTCPTPSYDGSNGIGAGTPTPINSAVYAEQSIAANSWGTFTITNASWFSTLTNASAGCLYIYRTDSTSDYIELDGAKTSYKPTIKIYWSPK